MTIEHKTEQTGIKPIHYYGTESEHCHACDVQFQVGFRVEKQVFLDAGGVNMVDGDTEYFVCAGCAATLGLNAREG